MIMINPSETDIQTAICEYLNLICYQKKFVFFSVPNEAALMAAGIAKLSNKIKFAIIGLLRKLGLLPGVSDLVLTHNGKAYFLEVKINFKKKGF